MQIKTARISEAKGRNTLHKLIFELDTLHFWYAKDFAVFSETWLNWKLGCISLLILADQ